MHRTAMYHGGLFFDTYLKNKQKITIVDVGSQDVNGSLRVLADKTWNYIGVDFVKGKGVDVVMSDPYKLPFPDDHADTVVSTSCFEHSEFFWLTFNELVRVSKPGGLIYINAPSNGIFHRWPVDCWRFFPDSGVALQNWANRQGLDCALLESFVGQRKNDIWRDFVAVFVKGEVHAEKHSDRMQYHIENFMNGRLLHSDTIYRHTQKMDEVEERTLEQLMEKLSHLEIENGELTKTLGHLTAERNTKGAKIGRQITKIGGQLHKLRNRLRL